MDNEQVQEWIDRVIEQTFGVVQFKGFPLLRSLDLCPYCGNYHFKEIICPPMAEDTTNKRYFTE